MARLEMQSLDIIIPLNTKHRQFITTPAAAAAIIIFAIFINASGHRYNGQIKPVSQLP